MTDKRTFRWANEWIASSRRTPPSPVRWSGSARRVSRSRNPLLADSAFHLRATNLSGAPVFRAVGHARNTPLATTSDAATGRTVPCRPDCTRDQDRTHPPHARSSGGDGVLSLPAIAMWPIGFIVSVDSFYGTADETASSLAAIHE